MHIAIWLLCAFVLALWTLTAWGLATLLGMDPSWVGELKPLVQQIPYADLIERWLPGWQALLLSLMDLTRELLGWAGGAGRWIVWALWGVGALLLAGTAAVLSLAVALVRRASTPRPAPAAP